MNPLSFRLAVEQAFPIHWKARSDRYSFYGNVCRICFIDTPLKRCSACKTVSYCSALHQKADWRLHKKMCKAVKIAKSKYPIEKNCSPEDFFEKKDKQATFVKQYLGESLFEDELEMCLLPWVCQVCYDDDVKFKCDNCTVVGYCSLEHKREDEAGHMPNCYSLKIAKIVNSRYFVNGFKYESDYHLTIVFPENILIFPSDMKALRNYLQPKIRFTKVLDNNLHEIIFSNQYSIPATIIYILETIKIVFFRINKKKPTLDEEMREACFALHNIIPLPLKILKSNTMTIHFVVSDYYEIQQNWQLFIKILITWIRNVVFIEITLIGESLINLEQPNLQKNSNIFSVQYHPFKYETIYQQLVKPDMIVLLNYGSGTKKNIFNDKASKETLFHHKDVPLVVTSIKEEILSRFVDESKQIDGVNVKMDVHKNPFEDFCVQRIWDEKHMTTYKNNEYLCVLSKE